MIHSLPFTPYPVERTTHDCPLCGENEATEISQTDRRFKTNTHVKCDACGMVRQHPLPSESALADYYRHYYRSDYQKQVEPSQKHIKKRIKEATRRFDRLSGELPTKAAIVDFGCGSGEFIQLSVARGHTAGGFEPGQGYARYARDVAGLDVECVGWQDYKPKQPADAVTTFHVFEHLVNPVDAFAKAVSWLNDDGLVYIEVPNIARSLARKGFGCLHFAHTLGFGRFSLELLGAVNGFGVVQVFDDYDIGLVLRKGGARKLADIRADSVQELNDWNLTTVRRQYWDYTASKILPWRRK